MTETKDTTETLPGYPPGWQPEEIRTIEVQPLPEDQQPPAPLDEDTQEELDQLQVLYPHDVVLVEYDEDGKASLVTPDGKTLKEKQAEAKAVAEGDDKKAEAKHEKAEPQHEKAEPKHEAKSTSAKK